MVGCALLSVATRVFAEPPVNTNGTPYAIAGYDPVAYFENQRAVPGSKDFAFKYQGATWLFASEPHKRAFEASPARYAPRYGGHCAFAAAQGRLVKIDPQAWSIVRDRLYLNYSLAIRDQWNADRDRFIRLADAHWPTPSAANRSRARSIAFTVADLNCPGRCPGVDASRPEGVELVVVVERAARSAARWAPQVTA